MSIKRMESQSSFECGKPGQRHKIYYWSVEELVERKKQLELAGLWNGGEE